MARHETRTALLMPVMYGITRAGLPFLAFFVRLRSAEAGAVAVKPGAATLACRVAASADIALTGEASEPASAKETMMAWRRIG